MFPHGCKEIIPKNIVGFQINEMRHILHKAEGQDAVPLTAEQEALIEEVFLEAGWKYSIDESRDKIWTKELDWKNDEHIRRASIGVK